MPHIMFVGVDPYEVRRGVWQLLFNDTYDLTPLTNADNENGEAYGRTITGQQHLNEAVVSLLLYGKLAGYNWKNVLNVQVGCKCGAEVEFASKADAMLFKLAHGGE